MSDAADHLTARRPTRRTVLVGGAAVGAAGLLAGCGGSDTAAPTGSPAGATAGGTSPPAGGASTPAGAASTPAGAASSPAGAGAAALAKVSDVPVGGGAVIKAAKVVVTQPEEGTFKGFSAVCTHQGCIVARVADEQIQCDCHGSRFSIADGSVVNGPATRPLAETPVTVAGTDVVRG
jgi:Rieske Fe-S protein